MFTDVVGYSRMMARGEAHALDLLEEHNSIIRQSIEKHDGYIIKLIGDSVFSEFDNPENCTKSAIDIQIRLKERNELCRKNDRIQIRIGLHYGQVVVNGMKPAGHYTLNWDASAHASGIYFIKIQAGEYISTQKLMLLK